MKKGKWCICDTCAGEGITMIAVYEGGAHRERDAICPDCDGEGKFFFTAEAMVDAGIGSKTVETVIEAGVIVQQTIIDDPVWPSDYLHPAQSPLPTLYEQLKGHPNVKAIS
jgi:DnaJ-class molecular chaperone